MARVSPSTSAAGASTGSDSGLSSRASRSGLVVSVILGALRLGMGVLERQRGAVELVVDLDLGVLVTGPPDGEFAQRRHLVEPDHALAEQLQQCQEPRHPG